MKNQALCSWFGRPISNNSTGQTYQFIHLKIQIYYSHFPSIFCRNCQIHCFLHTVDAIPKRLNYLICIYASNCNSNTSFLWNTSSRSPEKPITRCVKKVLDKKEQKHPREKDLDFEMIFFIVLNVHPNCKQCKEEFRQLGCLKNHSNEKPIARRVWRVLGKLDLWNTKWKPYSYKKKTIFVGSRWAPRRWEKVCPLQLSPLR